MTRTLYRLVILLLLAASVLVSADMTDDVIRCKVCQRAIEHVYRKGEQLRRECQEESEDPRCHYINVHRFGIEEMTHSVCDELPKNYAAIHDSEFDLVFDDDPQHSAEAATAIKKSCVKWVHESHDELSSYIYANLDAKKSASLIVPSLQRRFCRYACDPNLRQPRRDAHDEL